jgi:deazaflavin-dependent oxidoreductase (nitroreductase family)
MGEVSFGDWVTAYPESWILRSIHRAPILLWRIGLGRVVGRAFVLVTARGRKSGLPRRTVISWHPMGGRIYSVCPYGERADWYRNVIADPRVIIQTHRGPGSAEAVRVTDDDELAGFYDVLERRDPAALEHLLDLADVVPEPGATVAAKDQIRVLRFDPVPPFGLSSQRADLAWIWGALTVLVLAWRVKAQRLCRPGLAR